MFVFSLKWVERVQAWNVPYRMFEWYFIRKPLLLTVLYHQIVKDGHIRKHIYVNTGTADGEGERERNRERQTERNRVKARRISNF